MIDKIIPASAMPIVSFAALTYKGAYSLMKSMSKLTLPFLLFFASINIYAKLL